MPGYQHHTDQVRQKSRPKPAVNIGDNSQNQESNSYIETVLNDPVVKFHTQFLGVQR